jgi:hypothetical protein
VNIVDFAESSVVLARIEDAHRQAAGPSAWTYTVRTLTGGIFRMYIPFALVNAESG